MAVPTGRAEAETELRSDDGTAPRVNVTHARIILATCCASVFIAGIDTNVLNVALPSLQRDFHASISGSQWAIDAYTLVLACLLMFSASTADRFGRRRVFQCGLALFGIGSLLCSVSPSLLWLVAFRMLQAVGGSMLNPVAMSIITVTFAEPRARAHAIGVWGGAIGVSIAAGPLIGGVLVQSVGWRSIFWINLPVVATAATLAGRFIPESKAPHGRRFDPVGQLLVIGLAGFLAYAIIEAPSVGWSSSMTVGCFVTAAACLVALILYERDRFEPLIDVRLFRSPPFSGAAGVALAAFTALGGFLILNTFYLQDIRHYSPLSAGAAVLPMPVMMAIFGPVSGKCVGRFGTRPPLLIGGGAITAAGVIGALPGPEPPALRLYLLYALIGLGLGWVNSAIIETAVSGMPRQQSAVAAGMISMQRQLGQAFGVAIVGSAIAAHVSSFVPGPGFDDAFQVSWSIMGGCGAIALVLGAITTGGWAKAKATLNDERMALELS